MSTFVLSKSVVDIQGLYQCVCSVEFPFTPPDSPRNRHTVRTGVGPRTLVCHHVSMFCPCVSTVGLWIGGVVSPVADRGCVSQCKSVFSLVCSCLDPLHWYVSKGSPCFFECISGCLGSGSQTLDRFPGWLLVGVRPSQWRKGTRRGRTRGLIELT